MTFGQLRDTLDDLVSHQSTIIDIKTLENTDITAFLDFPNDGRLKKWKINKVTKEGIILYNDEVARPKGHL